MAAAAVKAAARRRSRSSGWDWWQRLGCPARSCQLTDEQGPADRGHLREARSRDRSRSWTNSVASSDRLNKMIYDRVADEASFSVQVAQLEALWTRVRESRTIMLYRMYRELQPDQHKKFQEMIGGSATAHVNSGPGRSGATAGLGAGPYFFCFRSDKAMTIVSCVSARFWGLAVVVTAVAAPAMAQQGAGPRRQRLRNSHRRLLTSSARRGRPRRRPGPRRDERSSRPCRWRSRRTCDLKAARLDAAGDRLSSCSRHARRSNAAGLPARTVYNNSSAPVNNTNLDPDAVVGRARCGRTSTRANAAALPYYGSAFGITSTTVASRRNSSAGEPAQSELRVEPRQRISRQPLLAGFKIDQTAKQSANARRFSGRSPTSSFRQTIENTKANVRMAYWNLRRVDRAD